MTSLLCEKVGGGSVLIENENMSKLLSSASSIRRVKRNTESADSRAPYKHESLAEEFDTVDLVQHSMKLGTWLNDKNVKQVQKLDRKLKKKMPGEDVSGLLCAFPTDFWEKTDAQARKMKKEYMSILDTENTFVKDVDDFVKYKGMLDQRKKDILHKRWSDEVFEPIRREIIKEMDGRNYREHDRRKRELYREYLEYTNKRGNAFLDTYSPVEYFATGLHATRPVLLKGLKAETKKLKDPTNLLQDKYYDEERVQLRCTSGIRYTNKDIEKINLPPVPLVPLGRHGVNCNTWIRMANTEIESKQRQLARGKMLGTRNSVHFNMNEWAQVPPQIVAKVLEGEMKISKKKRFNQPLEAIEDLGHKHYGVDIDGPLITNVNQSLPGTALSV